MSQTTVRRVTKKKPASGQTVKRRVENLFFSRDESWLKFNQRVLEEAQDPANPLLERVKFLARTLQRIEDGYNQAQPLDEGGLTPQQRLDCLSKGMANFMKAQYVCWNEQ